MYLPAAIKYGISYDDFWKMNPRIMEIYQKGYMDEVKQKQQLMNYQAWLNNQYTMMAIGSAFNRKNKYPKKPFEFKDTKKIEETEENYRIEMENMISKLNRGLITKQV